MSIERIVGMAAFDSKNVNLGVISHAYTEGTRTIAVIDDSYEIVLASCSIVLNTLDDGFPREYVRVV